MRRFALFALLLSLAFPVTTAKAQFTGPSARGQEMTVAAAAAARPGTYVTLVGSITSHLREEYYLFRDATGEIRVEIADNIWRGRQVGPETRVRLLGEVDRTLTGTVYIWIKTLDLVN